MNFDAMPAPAQRAAMEAQEDEALAKYERLVSSSASDLGMTSWKYESAVEGAWDTWCRLKSRDRPTTHEFVFDRSASHHPDGRPRYGW